MMRNGRQMNSSRSNTESDVLKGLAAGLIGGLVASWTMNQFQALWSKLAEGDEQSQRKKTSQQGSGGQKGGGKKQQSKKSDEEQDDATIKTAATISENVFDHHLTKSEKKIAGPAVHYAFGGTMGALYGAATELGPGIVNAGAGLPFGTALFLTADEVAVPALGLSESPTQTPLSTHACALVSHFVYGATAECVRRVVRNALR